MRKQPARLAAFLLLVLPVLFLLPARAQSSGRGYRFERGGWSYVHLEGSPAEIGFEHGQLLAAEIADMVRVTQAENLHATKRGWAFYRAASRNMLWPRIDPEFQQELKGIAKGVRSKGFAVDLWDIVALNGLIELPEYYVPWLEARQKSQKTGAKIQPEGHCSAFIATGSYTRGGKIVVAHNNWTTYPAGERWTVIFDVKPAHGHAMVIDGLPGVITSEDDFGVNDAGLMVTETTITQFVGWDPNATPEFVRSRRALQYAGSIDEYVRLIQQGNNGGYANDWLIGDRNTGEIAYLELGLKNTPLWRTKDGYFISTNFPRDPKLIAEETDGWKVDDLSSSPNARRVTAEKRIAADRGQIDILSAERYLSDHEDSWNHSTSGDAHSLCGHTDRDPRGVPEWDEPPFAAEGAVTGKVTDSDLAAKMGLVARAGHPCGEDFLAEPYLKQHPEFEYLRPILRDMKSGPWTEFHAGETGNRE